MSTREITKKALVVGIYVGLTFAFSFLAYGDIQFRIAEALVLLVFFKRNYAFPLILACLIANLPSPLGIVDLLFGTAGTALAVLGISVVSKYQRFFGHRLVALLAASMMPVLANGFLVGLELYLFLDLPFWFSAASVAFGEFVVVSVFGVALFSALGRNKTFLHLIDADLQSLN